jgi:hypothetical protein
MRRIFVFFSIVLFITACTPSRTSSVRRSSSSKKEEDVYTGIDLSHISDYQTAYDIEFNGDYTWRYSLITHFDGKRTEYNLHVEGVDAKYNPGDIRVVAEKETSWMTGPGAEHECFMFPSGFDIGYTFLTPDDTFPPEEITSLLTYESKQKENDLSIYVYTADVPEHMGWRNLDIVLWLVKDGDYPVKYDIEATGQDPLFNAGEGQFRGTFSVTDDSGYAIKPITGCELSIPLPKDATQVVHFPGLISFETSDTPEDVIGFYQDYLISNGWVADEPLTGSDLGMQMSYIKGDEMLVFYFKIDEEKGVTVEILEK